MAIDPKRFIGMFVADSRDNLVRLGDGLTALAANTGDAEVINTLFRAAHTIKGSARMIKLTTVTETAHKLEDVLGALRDGQIAVTPRLIDLMSKAADALSSLVDRVADGQELPPPDADLCAALTQASTLDGDAPAPVVAAPPVAIHAPPVESSSDVQFRAPDTVRLHLSKLDDLIKLMAELNASHNRLMQWLSAIKIEEKCLAAGDSNTNTLVDHRRWLHGFFGGLRDDVLAQGLLMTELGGVALSMRMLPLSWTFEPATRLVRELSRSLGKPVECVASGSEIELDRHVIDRLSDPLVHILRNCIDHGIESPADRVAAGKPAQGRIHLSARQDGAAVIIEISDDGGGIPLDRVRAKAVQKGLVDAERAQGLSEAQLIDLIFLPGFSTSAIITDLSGRGVGMDVVKKTILDELRGIVTVETRAGQGTLFRIRLPVSLSMMRVLVCQSGDVPPDVEICLAGIAG